MEKTYDTKFLIEVQAFVDRQFDAWGKLARDHAAREMSKALENGTLRAWFAEMTA